MTGFPIVHIDFVSKDPQASSQFFNQLFGWKLHHDPNFEDYPMFIPESGPGGGFMSPDGEINKPGDIILYAEADDIEAALAKVKALGGQVLQEKTDIPGVGQYAVIMEPNGVRLALYKGMERE